MDKEGAAKVVAGTGATGVGSYLVVKSLKKSGEPEKKEIVSEVVKVVRKKKPASPETTKKAGDYIYRRAILKKNGRVLQRKIETRAAGLGGANWFAPNGPVGRAIRVFSVNEENNMILLREKSFAESRLEKTGRGYGTAAYWNGPIKGIIAVKSGRKAAKKAEEEGKSESEMIEAAGKKATRVAGGLNAAKVAGVAGLAGLGARKLAKNESVKKAAKEIIEKNAGKHAGEIIKAVKAGSKRLPARVAGVTAGIMLPAAIIASRRAGDAARKNVSKGLVKSHKENK